MKKPCLTLGCKELVDAGRCKKHQRKEHRQDRRRRGSAAQRGYDHRWQKARETYLRDNPLCANCKRNGRTQAGNLIDHIIPVVNGQKDPLFWNTLNWQTLCTECDVRVKKPLDAEIRRQYDDGLTLEQAKRYAFNLMSK